MRHDICPGVFVSRVKREDGTEILAQRERKK
jgi:hypothetical protein